jgi:hypothetical protein
VKANSGGTSPVRTGLAQRIPCKQGNLQGVTKNPGSLCYGSRNYSSNNNDLRGDSLEK